MSPPPPDLCLHHVYRGTGRGAPTQRTSPDGDSGAGPEVTLSPVRCALRLLPSLPAPPGTEPVQLGCLGGLSPAQLRGERQGWRPALTPSPSSYVLLPKTWPKGEGCARTAKPLSPGALESGPSLLKGLFAEKLRLGK